MPFASITRLRLRSIRFVPRFIYDAFRALQQARASDGCLAADVRTIKARVFWTRTLWRDGAAMSAYRASGAHRATMPKLQHWCDEAAVVHWEQERRRCRRGAKPRRACARRDVSRVCAIPPPRTRAARRCRRLKRVAPSIDKGPSP
jgi:quinol monooxygenase YgiN